MSIKQITSNELPLFKLVTYKASYSIGRNGNGANSGQKNIAFDSFQDSHGNVYSPTLIGGYQAVGFTWVSTGSNKVAFGGINLGTTPSDLSNGWMARAHSHEGTSGTSDLIFTINVFYMRNRFSEQILINPHIKPLDIKYVEFNYTHSSSISAGGNVGYNYTAYNLQIPRGYYPIGMTRFDTGTAYCVLCGGGPFFYGRSIKYVLADATSNTSKRMMHVRNPSSSARTPPTSITLACIPEEYVQHPEGIAEYEIWTPEEGA